MTWHQWHDEYPTDRRTGTSRPLASANASSPHSNQSTGLSLCWSRYGEVALASLFGIDARLPRDKGSSDDAISAKIVPIPARREAPGGVNWGDKQPTTYRGW